MKKVLSFLVFGFMAACVQAQNFSVDDFIELSAYSPKKLETFISKKGFVPSNRAYEDEGVVNTWMQASKSNDNNNASFPTVRQFSKYQRGENVSFCFQTSSLQEQDAAIARLKSEGFSMGYSKFNNDSVLLFQKKNTTVRAYTYQEDSITFYCMYFENKAIPAPRSIRYAGDLLKFESHEILVASFGEANVVKDRYHFDGNDVNACSVLFPNTPRQAVFIWTDQQNMTGLDQVIISGNLPTDGASNFHQQITENNWQLEDGIRFNMRLEELVRANGNDVSFYGRNSDYNFMVVPQKKGEIDFSNIGIVLDCINCEGAPLLNKNIVNANEAFDQSLRLHVGMIILFPPKEHDKKYASR